MDHQIRLLLDQRRDKRMSVSESVHSQPARKIKVKVAVRVAEAHPSPFSKASGFRL